MKGEIESATITSLAEPKYSSASRILNVEDIKYKKLNSLDVAFIKSLGNIKEKQKKRKIVKNRNGKYFP